MDDLKVICIGDYKKVTCILDYQKVLRIFDYQKVICIPDYQKVICILDYQKVICILDYQKVICITEESDDFLHAGLSGRPLRVGSDPPCWLQVQTIIQGHLHSFYCLCFQQQQDRMGELTSHIDVNLSKT